MPEIDPRKSLQASPKKPTAVKPPVETTTGRTAGQAGQVSRAVQAAAVPSQVDVPPVEMEDAGETEKVSELQDLWLQLQEGQRLWRQTTRLPRCDGHCVDEFESTRSGRSTAPKIPRKQGLIESCAKWHGFRAELVFELTMFSFLVQALEFWRQKIQWIY
eukprot:symbB.v1.2.012398.t1/scaffold857.1/size218589/13